MSNSLLVKKNKVVSGYTKVYPLAYVNGIIDSDTNKSLDLILKQVNHIYLPYVSNKLATRASLPVKYRRTGIWITYKAGNEYITESYIGKQINTAIDKEFVDDDNWQIVPDLKYINDASSRIPDGAILPSHLSDELWSLLTNTAPIYNIPDGEDLTESCHVLKFKDRPCNKNLAVSTGYKILRKNWVGGVNTLTQGMISDVNTIYEIRYDFSLQKVAITVPSGSVLLFKGGTLNNGTVVCNDTDILGIHKFDDGGNAVFTGTFRKGLVMNMGSTIMWYDGSTWKKIEGTGSGGGTIDNLSARVVSVSSPATATATASVVGSEILFTFGLPKGEKGEKGDKGEQGIQGIQGETGPQGEPGPQGPAGDVSVASKTFIIFKSTGTSLTAPDTPTGGHWDSSTDEFTAPTGWSISDSLTGYIWMSSGIFMSDTGELSGSWSVPLKITGDNGANGTDGTTTEFIYKLTATQLITPSLDLTDSPNINEYVPPGWTDSPTGISSDMQVEWVSTRKKDSDGNWGNWKSPAIWSKWGINGVDGDGVEYIYYRNNGASVSNPTPSDTTSDQYQEKGDYEGIEYVPSGWSDDPQGVSSTYKYEWVCSRKYKNGVWGTFSDPAVWAKYGDDGTNGSNGLSLRTLYAKAALGETPAVVTDNINPGSAWGAVFPTYDSETHAVWAIQAYVTYDNKLATEEQGASYTGWQGPWIVTGVAGKSGTPPNYKTYIYKLADSKPSVPTSTDIIPDGWSDYPNTTGQWWQCIGTVDGTTNMVIEWSEVLPVNGQDGTALDGKKVEFRFATNTSLTSYPTINVTLRTPSGWSINPPTVNSGYYLWMTVATINPDDTLYTNWSTPVRISGELGPKGDTGPAGPSGPTGSQGVSGIPGASFDVRYCLGTASSYTGTSSPSGDSPSGWSSSVPTTNSTYPYVWCILGKRTYSSASDSTGTVSWGSPFKLSGTNGLNGLDGSTGIGISSVTEYYAVSSSNSTAPTSWSTTVPTMTTTNKYLWNYERTYYTDGSYTDTSKRVIGAYGNTGAAGGKGDKGDTGVGIKTITNYYLATSASSGVTTSTSGWTTTVLTVTTTNKYLWNYEKITYTDSSVLTTDPRIIGVYGDTGKRGLLVYPAGIYSTSISYTTDSNKAPYVLDTSDGNFYVLNAQMTWLGTSQSNRTPALDYAANSGKYWLKFEAFEAVHAKIGIIANGLIGSAVFNGDYMFSQQGIDGIGNSNSDYQYFSPYIPYVKGIKNYSSSGVVPIEGEEGYLYYTGSNYQAYYKDEWYIIATSLSSIFQPNFCVNLATGQVWAGAGKIVLASDGSGLLASGNILWDSAGNLEVTGIFKNKWLEIEPSSVGTASATYDLGNLLDSSQPIALKSNHLKLVPSTSSSNTPVGAFITMPTDSAFEGTLLFINFKFINTYLSTDGSVGKYGFVGPSIYSPKGVAYDISVRFLFLMMSFIMLDGKWYVEYPIA